MFPRSLYRNLLVVAVLAAAGQASCANELLQQRVAASLAELDGAEDRFVVPDPDWFLETQQALREETKLVDANLESHGADYAAAWKQHLRWPLLTQSLGPVETVDVDELALVRRWLYSNRKGLEYPFFAQLRVRTEAHLDAVYTFSQPDLQEKFEQQVSRARQQLRELAAEPSDAHVAALGRTLGWFEQTRQLPTETAAVRSLVSFPNSQIFVRKDLMDRALASLATVVEQSLPVTDQVETPKSGVLARSRTAHVRGMAHTKGKINLELEANSELADLQLVYLGEIESHCRAVIGPVQVAMQTIGPVRAVTPILISLQGVELLGTEASPQVHTRVTGVNADSNLLRRIGERRAYEPESLQHMNSRARLKAGSLLREEMDERVAEALAEIQAELRKAQESLGSFSEVLAPVVREGAAPYWHGIESTAEGIVVKVASQRREQLGAVTECPPTGIEADLESRIHVSFFNNMGETIMGGKTFTDEYFMNYGKILQAELPPPLMVHSRSKRWAIVARKPRPLEISIPAANQFQIELRMSEVQIDGESYTGTTIATMRYELVQDEYKEFHLERQGDVQLDSPLTDAAQKFLLSKLNAFFAPVLDGGGVALPEGGTLGRLRGLQPQGVFADQGWIAMGVDIPNEVLDDWLPNLQE